VFNNLGIKGRLDLYINKSNNPSQISSSSVLDSQSSLSVAPAHGLDLDRLSSISSDINDSLSPNLVNSMNELFGHEVIK
jgi:hypothetical protein